MRPSPYSHRRLGPALAALPVVGELDPPGGFVVEGDVGDVGVERLAHVLADELDQPVEVELRRERLADAVHRRELADALARLLHEAGVLERDAEAAGHRRQELLVGLVEGVLAIDVLERDHARPPCRPRRAGRTGRTSASRRPRSAAVPLGLGVEVLGDQQRLARLEHVLREPGQRSRLRLQPLAALDQVRVMDEPGRLVDRRDRDDLRVEDVADPVADGVVDRLRVELARDRLLHAVDQRQLGVPLPRLVHQPRVLERHAEAARQRLQQLLVGLAERVLAVDVLRGEIDAVALPPVTSGTNRTDFGISLAQRRGCRTARPAGPCSR